MQNSRGQGREGGETGGREEDAGADSKIKEDEEEDRDGEREKSGEGRREPDRDEGKRKAEVKVYRSTHPPNQTWNSIFHNSQVQMDLHHTNGLMSCIDFQLFVELIIPVWRAERTRQ